MTWIKNLIDLYDYSMNDEGSFGENVLVPISNITMNSQVEITISESSEFIRASVIPKDEAKTIVPCTIESSVRTSAPRPHLLFDNMSYLAGDLKDYINDTVRANKVYNEFFEPFIEQLKKWAESEYSNKYVKTIYNYLLKERLTTDLIKAGIIERDENGELVEKKIENVTPDKYMIRIKIEEDGKIFEPWSDLDFMKLSSEYYLNMLEKENKSLCYSTGKISYITPVHGKYIRFPGDGSKLLSSNDSTNFTFKGRFKKADECAQISYEASEKAHSALRWIIRKQGYTNDGYTVVSWSNRNSNIPMVNEDSDGFMLDFFNQESVIEKKETDTGEVYAKNLRDAVNGYKANFKKGEKVTIMALNSATPGRLSILYYRDLYAGEYVDRLKDWYSSISWKHSYKKDEDTKKLYQFIGAASPMDIIKTCFGVQRGEFMDLDNKIINRQFERLMPCIIDGKRIPLDFVMGAYRNGVNPVTKSNYNWRKCLTISCGLSKKYYSERMGEEIDMKLDENNNNRSYLYGRLLAIANRIEDTYYFRNDIQRMPTALRLMEALSKRPYKTWANLQLRLIPYLQGTGSKSRNYYLGLIDQIMVQFKEGDFNKNRPLEPMFLMGFHAQSEALKKVKKEDEKNSIKKEDES